MLTIHTLRALKDNFLYVLEGPDNQCAAIDPGEATPVLRWLADHPGRRLTHILCTHLHWDHVNGVADLRAATGASVVSASAYDRTRVPECNLALDEAHPLVLWGEEVSIIETPGHTAGQIAYYFVREGALFTGDTLFSAGCGRLFEGTPQEMFESLKKLKALPLETKVYFGHEYTVRNLEFVLSREKNAAAENYLAEVRGRRGLPTSPTTLRLELEVNPFLRASSATEFAEWREARNHW